MPFNFAIVTRGVPGLGTIKAVKELKERQIEIPTGIIIPVGSGKPALGIGR